VQFVYFSVSGDDTAIDVATCFTGNRFLKYNVSMMAYGYYGDCIVGSESNRWMGPKRYDWEGEEDHRLICKCNALNLFVAGFKKVVANKSYEGELSYLPSPDKENHTRDGTFCKAG
jgi:ceramide kinase